MYKDEVLKDYYYREYLAKAYAQAGLTQRKQDLDQRIQEIDEKLAVYRFAKINNGQVFNAPQFANDIALIYKDLEVLYQLLEEMEKEDIPRLIAFSEHHLQELEQQAAIYEAKMEMEMNVLPIGETALFYTGGWNKEHNATEAQYALPSFEAKAGNSLAFTFAGQDKEANASYLSFTCDGHAVKLLPYEEALTYYQIPGSPTVKTYLCAIDQTLTTIQKELVASGLEPQEENRYLLFSKEQQAQIGSDADYTYVPLSPQVAITVPAGIVEFYLYHGTKATFDFSKKPASQNFAGTVLNSLPTYQRIWMRFAESTTFSIQTDAKIFASCRQGFVSNGHLYSSGLTDSLVVIEEISDGNNVSIEDVRLITNTETQPQSVIVKDVGMPAIIVPQEVLST